MTTLYAINKTTKSGTRNWMGKVIGRYSTEADMMDELTEYSFVARSGRDRAVYVAYSYTEESEY